jgi:hypothetical protein
MPADAQTVAIVRKNFVVLSLASKFAILPLSMKETLQTEKRYWRSN